MSILLSHYVDKQGLGGIPKPDLDALIIYLYTEYNNEKFDVFSLGQKFRIKESKVKSLYETGVIKYSGLTEGTGWIKILTELKSTRFELDSYEKGQIRYKFENPALYKFFHKRLRVIGSNAAFSSSYETITISLETFFHLLDHVYDASQTQFSSDDTDEIHKLVEPVIKQLGSSLGEKKLKALKNGNDSKTKAGRALAFAVGLANIGSFISAILP